MAVDLTPRQPTKAYGGEGGAYYEWSPAELPMLGVASIGAAKLSLAAGGMSLPSYSDSAKVAYVLQGIIVLPIDSLVPRSRIVGWLFRFECVRSEVLVFDAGSS
jgi:hypothetical protein